MLSTDKLDLLAVALAKAQQLIQPAKKNATNPFFKSGYANLDAVWEAVRLPLNNNGLCILQPIKDNSVETVLLHTSGQWISSSTPVVCAKQNDPQALGAAITYARRYGLAALLSLPVEDDDAESAVVRKPQQQPKRYPPSSSYSPSHGETVGSRPLATTTSAGTTASSQPRTAVGGVFATMPQIKKIQEILEKRNESVDRVLKKYNVTALRQLTLMQASDVIGELLS